MEAPKTHVLCHVDRGHMGTCLLCVLFSRLHAHLGYCFFPENQTRFTNFKLSKLINYTYLTNIWALSDIIRRFKAAILFLNVVREVNVLREEVVVCIGCFRVLTPSRLVRCQNIECMPRVERGLDSRFRYSTGRLYSNVYHFMIGKRYPMQSENT